MELPVLPLNLAAGARHLEGDALGLGDVDGLQVSSVTTLLLDGEVVVLQGRVQPQRSANLGDIDGDNLLLSGVPDGAEVQRVLVLAVVDIGAVVHQSLLKTHAASESLVVADRPGVAVDLVHLIRGNAANTALLDDLGVDTAGVLNSRELLNGDLCFKSALELYMRIGRLTMGWAP